jgi:hypothetical protein
VAAGWRRRPQAAFPFAPHSPQNGERRHSRFRNCLIPLEPAPGFEPGTYGLQDRSSTPELCRLRWGPQRALPRRAKRAFGRVGARPTAFSV